MAEELIKSLQKEMGKIIENLNKELGKVRTGRASITLLDGIKVDSYGQVTPLNQVAKLSILDSRMIGIQPWDKSMLGPIEKAILKSDLGLTPKNDGKIIRVAIPTLTEERRKELSKHVEKLVEKYRITLRQERKTGNDQLKEMETAKKLTEDQLHKSQKRIQDLTDQFIKQADEIMENKKKEIMEI